MKVLLLFPMADGQTGPAIKYAFEKLGHTVRAVDAKRQPGNGYIVAQQLKPDLVFCSRTKALADQIIQIKHLWPDTNTCMWNVDTRASTGDWTHLFPLIRAVDYHFVSEFNLLDEWRKHNPRTFWLPQGLQEEVYKKPENITDADRQKYLCDVCFIGSARRHRDPFLEIVNRMDLFFYKWGQLGSPRIYNKEHNKAVSLSKINLCISSFPENERCISVRDYKIMGAGGFVLELYRRGIYDIFPASILDCYKTPEDLREKIRYWLDHEKERMEIAEKGYNWVHENATYIHRIQVAIDHMKENPC